jgi:hypothetical protein
MFLPEIKYDWSERISKELLTNKCIEKGCKKPEVICTYCGGPCIQRSGHIQIQ